MFYIYILECNDGTYYTGWTVNLENRLETHNKGNGAKYTRSRLPVKIVYFEKLVSKNEALKREIKIKKMRRSEKEKLVYSLTDASKIASIKSDRE